MARWGTWSVVLAVASAGCIAGTSELVGGELVAPVPGVGEPARYVCLELDEDFLRFVNAEAGERHAREAVVLSHCAWDVELTDLVLESPDGGFTIEASTLPATLRAGGRYALTVVYSGSDATPQESGSLQFVFEGFIDPRLRLRTRGDVVTPRIELDATALDFGEVVYDPRGEIGTSSYCTSNLRYVHVKNVGFGPLEVGIVNASAPFSVEFVEVGGTLRQRGAAFSLERGERAEIAFRYSPTAYGDQNTSVRLVHNAPGGASPIALSGRGITATRLVETFEQGTNVAVDILWAIDSSGSMEEEQARLRENLSRFVGYAEGLRADYQMAVIEAQELAEGAGAFRACAPHPPVVGSSYANEAMRDEAFRCMVDVGTTGFATETAAGAARIALERAQSADQSTDNPNAGFLRPHADLAIVAISDEDDQSLLPDEVLMDAMWAAKGFDRSRVFFHAIAGPLPSGCPYANRALRYSEMVAMTGGLFLGICSDDWSLLLASLGLDVFRRRDRFGLAHLADEATIEVRVDGVPIPPSAVSGFTYDPDGRWIRFTEDRLPGEGATIEVSYVPRCPR